MTTPLRLIDTERTSEHLRARSVDLTNNRLLITRLEGSEQEKDFSVPPNCDGFGRIRHFRRDTSMGWPSNPLPIDPVCKALGLPLTDIIEAQVFQNAACNWRCWYCFVPYELLSANPRHSDWISASDLVELYLREPNRPPMIDLTGGQPDLVPEWVPWMMRELKLRGLEDQVYLWSDDNLSNDYFWRYLSEQDIELVAGFRNYGRVCCFKGFNAESFSFNTLASPSLFDQQFKLMRRLLALGIDIYAYVTFTTPSPNHIEQDMARFVDRLQELDPNLPLRTVPLEVRVFTPVKGRMHQVHEQAMLHQQLAITAWQDELDARFGKQLLSQRITEVKLSKGLL